MHWADSVAQKIIDVFPDLDEYPLAAGISPSGPVHVGNLRDVATIHFVARSLNELGHNTRLIFSWDEFDRFRKVPSGLPASFQEYVGMALTALPDPNACHVSYARYYEHAFEESLSTLNIPLEYRYQSTLYQSGVYDSAIAEAMENRGAIFDILNDFRTTKLPPSERQHFYPISVYCQQCRKDFTDIVSYDADQKRVRYKCLTCHAEFDVPLSGASNIKLPWKIDWPMRWRHERIIFEPGGKDHATLGGSFDVSSRISREIFRYEPPMFQPYEFVGIKGMTGKMSSSAGILFTPAELMEIYQPEILLWLFARVSPTRAFDVHVDEHIVRLYDDYDGVLRRHLDGVRDVETRSVELSSIPNRQATPIPFRYLAGFTGISGGNVGALQSLLQRLGLKPSTKDLAERFAKAQRWVTLYAPQYAVALRENKDQNYYSNLSDDERDWLREFVAWIKDTPVITADAASARLYEIPKRGASPSEVKRRQKQFFEVLYRLLFGQEQGPRLGTFFAALPKTQYLGLLE